MEKSMHLKEIIADGMTIVGDDKICVHGLSHNSKDKNPQGLFFAINGKENNGEEYALEAIKNGAVCVVTENYLNLPNNICQVLCDDARIAMSVIAANFYKNAHKDMFIVAVTGTNGKTTSTYMLANMYRAAGKKVGIIGTNGIFAMDEKIGQNLTTPDPIELHKTFAIFKEKGVGIVCMEMSAHALELQKNWGIMTDIALFTNLTQDHLDFFETMKNYGSAKAKLFTPEFAKKAVINVDDDFGFTLFKSVNIPAVAYAREKGAKQERLQASDIIATDEKVCPDGSGQDFTVSVFGNDHKIHLNIDGGFNVSNALGVIGAGYLSGLSLETIASGLGKLEQVEGRFNTYMVGGVKVIIDYAHTPDGIMNILCAARELAGENRVISVFGCGGNRDSSKRKIMGEISSEYADFTFITSDNPRFEEPLDIARQIEEGFKRPNYKVIVDRRRATKTAIEFAKPGDIVVLAGKGAENYMDKKGQKTFYSDKSVVEEIKAEVEGHTKKK